MEGDRNAEYFRIPPAWENLWSNENNATKEIPAAVEIDQKAKITTRKKNSESSDNTDYDPQRLRPKSIISSEIISKNRLTSRDGKAQNSGAEPDESDEEFWENWKKRINENRDKIGTCKTSYPKRASIARKRRSLFNSESLNLVKKFRAEVAAKSDQMAEHHGMFTMSSHMNHEDQENVYATNFTTDASLVGANNDLSCEATFLESPINDALLESDVASCCPTPPIIMQELHNQVSITTSTILTNAHKNVF